MIAHKIKTHPDVEPVTLGNMRDFMGITRANDTARDSQIDAQIKAARLFAETYTDTAILTQTWTLLSPKFENKFNLRPELQSVLSVKYYDDAGALQTVSPAIYIVDTDTNSVQLAPNSAWPQSQARTSAVIIEYDCGYASVDEIPEPIILAIKFLVGHWEGSQKSIEGARITTVPYAVEQLLNPFRNLRNYFA